MCYRWGKRRNTYAVFLTFKLDYTQTICLKGRLLPWGRIFILLIFLLHINSYTPENSSNSVSPGKKREWIYLQWQREKHIGVAEAQLPSSLSLLERMYVFKCEIGFYILGKELSIAHRKFSGQDPLLSGKLSHPPQTTAGYRAISAICQHSRIRGRSSVQSRILSECRGT